ncbi:Uma2 family endonuclease [Thermus thermamylovorans]|uniref:Uma2 family endonuclease n=1 Tax=Thermus thermamylovorans TaxID=2509362 RepID=UPI001F22BE4A|nr:Uma2 family endonuclease [Thermus thermamylovorans]
MRDEELRALSEREPGWRFERGADGRLFVSPTGGEGGRMGRAALGQLTVGTRPSPWGWSSTLPRGSSCPTAPSSSPDAAFARKGRWLALTPEEREGFPPLAPGAAFEVRSRSQSVEELREKAALYLKNGVGLVVLLDLYAHRVEVFRKKGATFYQDQEAVPLDPGLPGFQPLAQGLFLALDALPPLGEA